MIPLRLWHYLNSEFWGIKIKDMAKANKGLTAYQKKKVKQNLIHWFERANTEQYNNGLEWYKDAHIFCQSRAEHFGVSEEVVAGVVSALSPRNKWERNLQDADRVLLAHKYNESPEAISVCTFTSNKLKAFDILEGKPVNWGPKTESFVKNIANLDRDRVTVDVWHWRACFDKMRAPKSLTEKKYRQIEKITIETATNYGLAGFQLQAVVWESIRGSWRY